jgi:hypothetical protein
MVINCSYLEKKKEKNKILWAQGKGIKYDVCFAGQDTVECMIRFRIDNRTIKRGNL